jgi:Leucine-rich repeat (LRR) protein
MKIYFLQYSMCSAVLFLLLLWLILFVANAAAAKCQDPIAQSEFEGLQSFYLAASHGGSTTWTWREPYSQYGNPWNFSSVGNNNDNSYLGLPCGNSWQGLGCEPVGAGSQCTIVSIGLDNYGLVGHISTNISLLTNVGNLSLAANALGSTLPSSIQYLSSLQTLDLQNNALSGSVPSELGLLSGLQVLNLAMNIFKHTIPSELFDATSLTSINFDINHLSGSIPSNLGQLSNLEELSMDVNILNNVLPTEIGLLTSLKTLSIRENSLSGQLPTEMSQLQLLKSIKLDGNSLEGAIPTELWSIQSLVDVEFSQNYFSSTLPTEIAFATLLEHLDVSSNRLLGSIPTEIGQLSSCTYLNVMINDLTGSFPLEIWSLTRLLTLEVSRNSLSVALPSNIMQLSSLTYLAMDNCNLIGTIPTEIGALSALGELDMSFNYFTSTLPSEIMLLSNLDILTLSGNLLSSPLPDFSAIDFDWMSSLLVNDNLFTGELPYSLFRGLRAAVYILLDSNYFSNTLPLSLEYMSAQPHFFADGNYFSGSIARELTFANFSMLTLGNNLITGPMFEVSRATHKFMTVLSIADNGFSGSLPSELFSLSALEIFVASGNCFSGELIVNCGANDEDNSYCEQSELAQLSLNELSSGFHCRCRIVPQSLYFSRAGYYPDSYMAGAIPFEQLFRLHLLSLYLEGNGFTGPIPDSLGSSNAAHSLFNFSVAYNQLTGTLPSSLQDSGMDYQYFDISHNRLSGTIGEAFQAQYMDESDVDISSNRFSGTIYQQYSEDNWEYIYSNMMKGNLFKLDLPFSAGASSDESNEHEHAIDNNGSTNLNVAMSAAVVVFVYAILGAGFVVAKHYRNETLFDWVLLSWIKQARDVLVSNEKFYKSLCGLYSLLAVAAVALVTVFTILYTIFKVSDLKTEYSTHSFQYSWLVSAVFMHGVTPVVCINLGLVVGLVAVQMRKDNIANQFSSTAKGESSDLFKVSSNNGPNTLGKLLTSASVGAFVFATTATVVNVIIVSIVNWAYLLAILRNNRRLQLVQFALSLFKCLWNNIFIPFATRRIRFELDKTAATFRYVLLLLNVIVIPCLVNSLVSEECFLQLFEETSTPTASGVCFTFSAKDVVVEGCSNELPLSAPFTYSYQCSSALIVNYVPVLLYAYAISGFVVPSMMMIFMVWKPWHVIDSVLPRLLREQHEIRQSLSRSPDTKDSAGLLSIVARPVSPPPLLPLARFPSTLVLDAVVFVTFGLSYPYLGVVILFSHLTSVCTWLLALGRYRYLRQESQLTTSSSLESSVAHKPELNNSVGTIDQEISSSLSRIHITTGDFVVVVVACFLYWAVVCFEMVADTHGVWNGLYAAITIAVGCPAFVVSCLFIKSGTGVDGMRSSSISLANYEPDASMAEALLPQDGPTDSSVII